MSQNILLHSVPFVARMPVRKALGSFYGVGPAVVQSIMAQHAIHRAALMDSLSPDKVDQLSNTLTGMRIDSDLRKQINENIHKLHQIGCYRGKRHAMGLPVRGQGTRTQINTARRLNRMNRR